MSPTRLAAVAAACVGLLLPASAAAKPEKRLYLSLGDSYAVGYQPKAAGLGAATRQGYADQLVGKAARRGWDLRLVNLGCGGETAASILERTAACRAPAVGAPSYAGRTQIAAAERVLRANRGRVGLVTVSIGGNDVTACAAPGKDPVTCVAGAVAPLKADVTKLVGRLRRAAGPKARIVGLTYPDVILGRWVGADADQNLARLSVAAFRTLINPALEEAYATAGARFVDVTAASGAYGSLDALVDAGPLGQVPGPVAEVCRLTWYCQVRDIHATKAGYGLIADLVARTLPRRRGASNR
jgi:lysophospholipase L1-like esterase